MACLAKLTKPMIRRNLRLKISEWPRVKALRFKSTSLETIFFPIKVENGNQAHLDNYNNNVHFEGVRFICGPHLAIIGPSEARADLMAR